MIHISDFFMNVYAFPAWLTIDIPVSCLFYLFVYIKCMVNVTQLSICSQTTLSKKRQGCVSLDVINYK